MAQERLDAFRVLSGTIAHEMRTPLVSISAAASGLGKHMPKLIDGHVEDMHLEALRALPHHMNVMCRRALNTIEMILIQMRGDAHFETERINASEVVKNGITAYSFSNSEFSLIDVSIDYDFTIEGSRIALQHVFFNLIKNSLHFILEGEGDTGQIRIWTSRHVEFNVIHFWDNGPGIAQSDVHRVFDQFFSRREHGTGMGLHFCKRILENMGGSIECISEQGKFTEIQLFFKTV